MRYRKFVLQNPKDDAAGGGAGGAGDKAVADAAQSAQQIELLTKSVGLLAEGLKSMEANQNQIVATLAKVTEQSKGDVKHQLEQKFGEDVDLEQLSRADFARYIMEHSDKNTQTALSKVLTSLDEKIQDLGARFEGKNASEQVDKMAGEKKDFWEWSTEIKELLKDNPTLTVRRAYNLVRSENPEKATAMDKKYTPPQGEKRSAGIGLTPTSMHIGARDGASKMKPMEAANKAYDDLMAELGNIDDRDLKLA